ncbi:Tetraspanin-7 [Liparis tanakae]|uniref:Tetraspanin n=1 Tax=Liparis tanakae TaxID=230148 RepID=A0A4Z2EXZ2_9TELE|nr:Tetraspanin-7 [Liparis tanakae]
MSPLRMEPLIFCLKMLLLLYCLVFWVTGVVLLAVGLWWSLMLSPYAALMASGPSGAPYALLATGGAIVLFGLFGCFAACRGRCWMLRLMRAAFLGSLGEAVQHYDGRDDSSLAVDALQRRLLCCGVHNYSSWLSSPFFPSGGIPSSCCVSFSDCSAADLRNATRAAARVHPQGCYELLTSSLQRNLGVIAGVTFSIAFSQLIGTSLACCLSRLISSNQYEMV